MAPLPADTRLDPLLTIEGVLGAVVVGRDGQIVASINLVEADAMPLRSATLAFAGEDGPSGEVGRDALRAHGFAVFALRDGQIAVSAGRGLNLIALTEAGLDAWALMGVLGEVLADLEADPGLPRSRRSA